MKESTQRCLVIIGLLVFSVSTLTTAYAASIEYLSLTARGESMDPTIKEGDTLRVRLCVNGSLINVGDIIVYCTIVTPDPHPEAMWIGHRVVKKYSKEGIWYFKTKGDNNPEPDSWEVPEYFLLGIVVEIIQNEIELSERSGYSQSSGRTAENIDSAIAIGKTLTVAMDLFTSLIIGILLGIATAKECRKLVSKPHISH